MGIGQVRRTILFTIDERVLTRQVRARLEQGLIPFWDDLFFRTRIDIAQWRLVNLYGWMDVITCIMLGSISSC